MGEGVVVNGFMIQGDYVGSYGFDVLGWGFQIDLCWVFWVLVDFFWLFKRVSFVGGINDV